jgi:hypothetical protein
MAAPKARKLKTITFTLGGSSFESQLKSWTLNNNTKVGNTTFTFGGNPDDPTLPGAIVEDTDPDWTLDLTFLADWASGGVSDYLTVHDTEQANFVLDHLPNQVGEHVRWVGAVKLAAPNVGGAANATEETQVSLKIVGSPVYSRIG